MRLGTTLPIRGPFADVVEQARTVEALGYDSIWVPEIAGRDALVMCAALAAQTERIGLATGIVPLPVRAPATLAMGAAGLAEITGGRFTLGVGLGHAETLRDWFGIDRPMRLTEAEEHLGFVREVLHTGASGAFRLRGAYPPFSPRLILAALGPGTASLAARLADGVVLNWVTPAQAASIAVILPKGHEIACMVPVCVTEDVPAARRELQRQIDAYGRLRAYDRVMESRDPDILGAHGSAAAVYARLAEYVDAGVTLPVLVPYPVGDDPWASMTETWSALADC